MMFKNPKELQEHKEKTTSEIESLALLIESKESYLRFLEKNANLIIESSNDSKEEENKMIKCTHDIKFWHASSIGELKDSFFKVDSVKSVFGHGLVVHSAICEKCKKTVIEITPEGNHKTEKEQEWVNPFSLRGLIQPGINVINDKVSRIDERLKHIEDVWAPMYKDFEKRG